MKKYKLKRWVKVVLIITAGVIILSMIGKSYNSKAKSCDLAKGYTCSHYEIREYAIRGN